MAGTAQRHYDDRLIASTIPLPRPCLNLGQSLSARFDQDPTNQAKERYPAKIWRSLSSTTTIGRRPTAIARVSDRSLSAEGTDPRT